MARYKIGEVAELLGVSVDTVRRWADAGRLATVRSPGGHRMVEASEVAAFLAGNREPARAEAIGAQSARNHFAGIVTRVVRDRVMAQVEIQVGPHRIVSLISREAADELGLEAGKRAIASVKATNVVIEVPR
ncbi:MAG TPA: TOBE domain-containing protein [Candidatus Dormibacteraeota bacterium]